MTDLQAMNKQFITKAINTLLANIDRSDFSGNKLSYQLFLSREQTHRKIKKYTGLSTNRFIRYIRLLVSIDHLLKGKLTVAEISYRVGFDSPAYFNKCFKDELGITPGKITLVKNLISCRNAPLIRFYQQQVVKDTLSENDIRFELPAPSKAKGTKIWWAAALSFPFIVIFLFLLISNNIKSNIELKEDHRIAVLPFVNHTGDSSLAELGNIISSWITGRIGGLDEVHTVPYFTIKQYESYLGILPDDPNKRPTFGELVNTNYLILGNYFVQGEDVIIESRLVDAYSQETVYQMPVMNGPIDSAMKVVENLRLKIAGLITNLETVKSGKLTPPNYEAYQYYLKGLEELSLNIDQSQSAPYFKKATELEPNFVMPQLYLAVWLSKPKERDSLFHLIEEIPNKTEYEILLYTIWSKTYNQNYREALDIALEGLKAYPLDYHLNMVVGHEAKSQFMPQLALNHLSKLHDPLESDVGLVWHHYKVFNYTESLFMLGRNKEALVYLNSIPEKFYNPTIPHVFITAHIKLNASCKEIELLINSFGDSDPRIVAGYYLSAAYEYSLLFRDKDKRYFAKKAAVLLDKIKNSDGIELQHIDALYLSGNYHGTKSYLQQKLKAYPSNQDYIINLAMVEATMANKEEAEKIYRLLNGKELIHSLRHDFEIQSDYLKARIHALVGEKEKAVDLLKSALNKGQLCHNQDFGRDIYLKPLFDYPPFQELIRPRKYTEVTQVQ